ncbi:MAG: 50S ribosomal protein L21 [Planctomycetales bacterium]|nr:50S ribosomal protein L21 [Planctomycetales bacterium]
MYAIVEDGGRQYKVQEGQFVNIDYRDIPAGESIQLDRVLAVSGGDGVKIGKPTVDGASVSAEVVGVEMGDKIYVQKLRRRKNLRRRTGHRQMYTRVKIGKIAV